MAGGVDDEQLVPLEDVSGVQNDPPVTDGVSVTPELLDENKLMQALIVAQELLADIEKSLIPAGKDRPELMSPEARQLAADIFHISDRIKSRAKGVLPELSFRPTHQVRPSPVAHDFVVKAREKAEMEDRNKAELISDTVGILSTIFQLQVDITRPDIAAKINAFAKKYATKSGLDIYMVITSFSDPQGDYFLGVDKSSIESAFKDDSVKGFINDPKTTIFRSGVLPSKHFEQLLHGKVAALVMDIRKTWQSRCTKEGEDEFLSDLMAKAKEYIAYTFHPKFLGDD